MRIKPWAAMAAAVPLAAGCVAAPQAAAPAPAAGGTPASSEKVSVPAPGAAATPSARPPRVPAGTTAAWVVFDRRQRAIVAHRNAHRRYRSASVVKILIAIDHLESHRTVPAADARLLRIMLRSSDDDAATSLWSRNGKGAIIVRTARRLGLSDTAPPPATHPGFWGYTSLSAYDIVRTYRYLLDRAAPRVRDTILGHLRKATPCGTDGFDQTFGIPRAVPRPWAVKQGWSGFGAVPTIRCRPAGQAGPAVPAGPAVEGSAIPGAPIPDGSAVVGAPISGGSISLVARRAAGTGVPDYGRPVLHTTGLAGGDDRFVIAVLTAHPAGGTWNASVRRITQLTAALYRNAS
ncbi:hypothetical protein [Nonomuraea cavernae]|uniref:Lipoprotein n=1 Tax=Nonomuraea cavernae TaxID=2045107 RepID=A0A917YQW7_9ACTN|nr:hypothetical protein [Nonomuraea cavernae]MCA2184415.1 hypothetical protein [Nonomuraea cavernae]GGO63870.1 lipoprotein [Nonomuraea cavernae]